MATDMWKENAKGTLESQARGMMRDTLGQFDAVIPKRLSRKKKGHGCVEETRRSVAGNPNTGGTL